MEVQAIRSSARDVAHGRRQSSRIPNSNTYNKANPLGIRNQKKKPGAHQKETFLIALSIQ
jgi:hypothetical protein